MNLTMNNHTKMKLTAYIVELTHSIKHKTHVYATLTIELI